MGKKAAKVAEIIRASKPDLTEGPGMRLHQQSGASSGKRPLRGLVQSLTELLGPERHSPVLMVGHRGNA